MAAAMTASDVTIENAQGQVSAITIDPAITVSWSGFDTVPTQVATDVHVSSTELGAGTTFTTTEPLSTSDQTLSNSVVLSPGLRDLTESPWTTKDFDATGPDGTQNVTPVTVSADVTLKNGDGTSLAAASADAATFTVTVTNA